MTTFGEQKNIFSLSVSSQFLPNFLFYISLILKDVFLSTSSSTVQLFEKYLYPTFSGGPVYYEVAHFFKGDSSCFSPVQNGAEVKRRLQISPRDKIIGRTRDFQVLKKLFFYQMGYVENKIGCNNWRVESSVFLRPRKKRRDLTNPF